MAEDTNPQISSVLGWISLGLGIGSITTDAQAMARAAAKNSRSDSLTKVKLPSENGGSQSVTWGGNMSNIDLLGDGLYTFSDTYQEGNCLNIAPHGELVDSSSRLIIKSKLNRSRYMDADELTSIFKNRYNMDDYDKIRTIACYSGNGGELSFGAWLNKATGKSAKSYINRITA